MSHALPALCDAPGCSCSRGREGMCQDASRTGAGRSSQPPAFRSGHGVSRPPAPSSSAFLVHHGSGKNHTHTAAGRIQHPSIQLFLWVGVWGRRGWGGDVGNRRLAGGNKITSLTFSFTTPKRKKNKNGNDTSSEWIC